MMVTMALDETAGKSFMSSTREEADDEDVLGLVSPRARKSKRDKTCKLLSCLNTCVPHSAGSTKMEII
jgi:hypothetical protein